MKKIQSLDKFETVNEKVKPPKVSGSFEISDNLKKVAKIQKTLIDLSQLLTEMSDEIVLLKTTYTNLDPESMNILTNMKYNIDNMVGALKRERKSGANTGVIDNSKRLQRNLERLKKDFLKRKSV